MKSKMTAYLLWLFLGLWGGHKFYLKKCTAYAELAVFWASI
jgi:TM2 domain-containing membrane protein YozV